MPIGLSTNNGRSNLRCPPDLGCVDMPPIKERTPELRTRIFEAAIDVLATQGVAAVTTRRVAAAAGTSPPAIYELFGHKAGLVRELFFEGFRRLLTALEQLDVSGNPADDLVQTLLTIRNFANANPRLFAVMYAQPFDVYAPNPEERRVGDGLAGSSFAA